MKLNELANQLTYSKNLTDAIVDPAGHPPEELRDDPPAAGDIGAAVSPGYSPDDLPGGFVYRRHPKPRPFGHLCVDKKPGWISVT